MNLLDAIIKEHENALAEAEKRRRGISELRGQLAELEVFAARLGTLIRDAMNIQEHDERSAFINAR